MVPWQENDRRPLAIASGLHAFHGHMVDESRRGDCLQTSPLWPLRCPRMRAIISCSTDSHWKENTTLLGDLTRVSRRRKEHHSSWDESWQRQGHSQCASVQDVLRFSSSSVMEPVTGETWWTKTNEPTRMPSTTGAVSSLRIPSQSVRTPNDSGASRKRTGQQRRLLRQRSIDRLVSVWNVHRIILVIKIPNTNRASLLSSHSSRRKTHCSSTPCVTWWLRQPARAWSRIRVLDTKRLDDSKDSRHPLCRE